MTTTEYHSFEFKCNIGISGYTLVYCNTGQKQVKREAVQCGYKMTQHVHTHIWLHTVQQEIFTGAKFRVNAIFTLE